MCIRDRRTIAKACALVLLCALCATTLFGCADAREIDDTAFVLSLGVDVYKRQPQFRQQVFPSLAVSLSRIALPTAAALPHEHLLDSPLHFGHAVLAQPVAHRPLLEQSGLSVFGLKGFDLLYHIAHLPIMQKFIDDVFLFEQRFIPERLTGLKAFLCHIV